MTRQQFINSLVCTEEAATVWLPEFVTAMARAQVNTPMRQAHFLAQVGHESGGLRYVREIAPKGVSPESYFESKYGLGTGPGKRLGNTQPGDGAKFYGRGPLQCTGRDNYTKFGQWRKEDYLAHPEYMERPLDGALFAAWYWMTRKLNVLADADDIAEITRKVNGGANGLNDRRARLALAKKALGVI